MNLKARYDTLAERERKLLLVLFGILGVMVFVFVPVLLRLSISEQSSKNERLREVIDTITSERATVAKVQAEAARIQKRYEAQAPSLAGWLARTADEVGIDIPESQDRSTVPRGKTFKERSTHIRLSKVGMFELSNFMEKVSTSSYPVVISRLTIKKRGSKGDEYDAEMDVTAFDKEEKKAPKKVTASAGAAEED